MRRCSLPLSAAPAALLSLLAPALLCVRLGIQGVPADTAPALLASRSLALLLLSLLC
jgi:hypothetical protein